MEWLLFHVLSLKILKEEEIIKCCQSLYLKNESKDLTEIFRVSEKRGCT